MNLTKQKRTDFQRLFFILIAAIVIMSLLLTACTPALDQPGGAGGNKDKDKDKDKGGGQDKDKGGGQDKDKGGGQDKDKGGGQDKDKGGGQNDQSSSGGTTGTQGEEDVKGGVRHVKNSKDKDPCLEDGALPCGQGDHGRGNPINGSLHANCRAAQGEVDPICEEEPPVCEGPDCDPPVCVGPKCDPPVCVGPDCDIPFCEGDDCGVERATPPGPSCPQWIVFHSFRFGDLEIFRLDGIEEADGSNVVNISNSTAADSRPSRSPDDNWIVFQSNRDGFVQLYLSDAEGNAQSRLTDSNANNINAMFGPDNQSVTFQSDRNGNWDIYIIDIDGTERQLTTSPAADVNPYWSPDEDWLVFQSNRNGTWDIYVLNISTGTEYAITDVPYDVTFPSWSPNGKQLAYLADWGGNWDLYVSDVQGENVQRLTDFGNAGNVTWSPDGDRLAFQVGNEESTDVFTYDMISGRQYQLTEFAGPDSAPTWDCTGANIAFTSLSSGNLDLFSVPWQGGAINNITFNPASDKWSEWSPSKEPASRGY